MFFRVLNETELPWLQQIHRNHIMMMSHFPQSNAADTFLNTTARRLFCMSSASLHATSRQLQRPFVQNKMHRWGGGVGGLLPRWTMRSKSRIVSSGPPPHQNPPYPSPAPPCLRPLVFLSPEACVFLQSSGPRTPCVFCHFCHFSGFSVLQKPQKSSATGAFISGLHCQYFAASAAFCGRFIFPLWGTTRHKTAAAHAVGGGAMWWLLQASGCQQCC